MMPELLELPEGPVATIFRVLGRQFPLCCSLETLELQKFRCLMFLGQKK